jgi:hypothetical protein
MGDVDRESEGGFKGRNQTASVLLHHADEMSAANQRATLLDVGYSPGGSSTLGHAATPAWQCTDLCRCVRVE